MLEVQTLFFSPGIWVVCSRPLKNDEQAVQHYYLKNDRQAVEHYQRTADAGRLCRTCHFNLARNSLLRIIFQDAQSSLKSPQLHLQATQLADQEITACLSGRSALAEKHAEIYGFPGFAK